MNVFKSLHFSRWLSVFFVSFWFVTSALGLDNVSTSAKTEIKQAHEYFNKKEYPKVTPLLWKNIDSLERRDFHILMKSHAEQNQGEELLRVSTLLISKNEKDFEALHYQGRAHFMQKKEKEGLESFKKAISANPKYLPSYLSVANFYESKNNLYELRVIYQDMLTAFGPKAEILTKLCEFHTKDGLNDTAEKYCLQASQKDAKIAENYVYLGMVYIQTGDRPKGRNTLKTTAERFSKSELALYTYGKVLEEDKNFIDAYKTYKNCHAADPKSDRCLLGYANSAFEIQKLEEAHDTYKKLCKINRNNSLHVRRALGSLRKSGPKDWTQKFQDLSDYCSL